MTRARTVLVVGVCLGAVLVVGGLWRSRHLRRAAAGYMTTQVRQGEAVYPTIHTRPIGSKEQIRDALGHTEFMNEPANRCGSRDALLDRVSAFLYYRFVQDSPEVYAQWRRSSGHHLKSLDEMIHPWFIDQAYEAYFNEPFPEDPDVEALFRKFWPIGLGWGEGVNRPVALADESKGLTIRFGTLAPGNPNRDMLDGQLGTDLWHGGIAATMRRWWRQPHDTQDLLDRFGRADYAEVGIIMGYADGSRRPLILTYLWDPIEHRWSLEHVNVNNFDSPDLSAMEY